MGPNEIVAYRLVVSGSVQGVGFRAFVVSLARRVGVSGSVKNLDDGSVEVIAESSPERMTRFLEGLKEGNGWSRTDFIAKTVLEPRGLRGFDVTF